MKVVYLHGYGSRYNPGSEKMLTLAKLGEVVGLDLDYGQGSETVRAMARDFTLQAGADLIVGTSMGGWLASHAAAATGTPFVALNPAMRPSRSLRKYIGNTVNYDGFDATIDAAAVASYADFQTAGARGLILCEAGDEVIDSHETIALLQQYYATELIPGGSHRFESLESQLEKIRRHCLSAGRTDEQEG